jgi:predicted transcriptional regulator of viral defense system
MNDMMTRQPDFAALFEIASTQHGHVTTAQARSVGFKDSLIAYHVGTGRLRRIHRGVYRLRDYPTSPRDGIVAAWLAVGKDRAVVSHESALELQELSDVISSATHLTVHRSFRNLRGLPETKMHTTTKDLGEKDVTTLDGIRLTSAARSIVDAAEAGTAPEQIEFAIKQAMKRGLTTRTRLLSSAQRRSQRVVSLVLNALDAA